MNEAESVFRHVVFAVLVELSVPRELLLFNESFTLSVALSFCSVFVLCLSCQRM